MEAEIDSGIVVAVCSSERTGTTKAEIACGHLIRGHGLEHDAHAGSWHRQVSLLDRSDIREMEAKGLVLEAGAFGENIVVEGVPLDTLGIGTRLAIGDAVIEISQIGKVCHDRCAIYEATGDCIMPRKGLFAEVLTSGEVRPGLAVRVLEAVPRDHHQVAVIASDTNKAALDAVMRQVEARPGAHLAWHGLLPPEAHSRFLNELCGRGLDLAIVLATDSARINETVGSTHRESDNHHHWTARIVVVDPHVGDPPLDALLDDLPPRRPAVMPALPSNQQETTP